MSIPRIFVGCPANNEDLEAMAVLDYSLRLHASGPIEVTWMMLSRDPNSFWYSASGVGWNTTGWATPFSALRWGIPAYCRYEGRAIYMDSDMIPVADIYELWNQNIPGNKVLLAKGGDTVISCVMLMDCERMRTILPPISRLKHAPGLYREVRGGLRGRVADYSGDWNCRDGENYPSTRDPRIKNHHYTSIPTQPNHRHARARIAREGGEHWYPGPDRPHPRPEITALFDERLAAAEAAGRGVEYFREDPVFGDYGPMNQYGKRRAA